MRNFIRSFKNIRLRPLLLLIASVLLFPVLLGCVQGHDWYNFFRIFSDTLLIEGFILVITGVILSFINHGDLDITAYNLKRSFDKSLKPYSVYKKDREAEHRAAFNYPLFLGLCCLIVSIVVAFIL